MDVQLDRIDWRGYWPAAPTPFTRTGHFDEVAWRSLLRLYLAQGVHGVVVNGSTGEWFSQSQEERRRVADLAVAELGGKIPVVIGCTSLSPSETVRLAEHARKIGADGAMATPPPYAVPTSREVFEFYRSIAAQVEIPLMVYNWPRGTNVDMDADLLGRIANLPTVVAVKDSTADLRRMVQNLEALHEKVPVFGTFINRPGLALLSEIGGAGSIDGGGLGAAFGVAFYEAFWRGDLVAARQAADRFTLLNDRLVTRDYAGRFGSSQAQLKAAMNLLGQPGGYPREPFLPVEDPDALKSIAMILRDAGLSDGAKPAAILSGDGEKRLMSPTSEDSLAAEG